MLFYFDIVQNKPKMQRLLSRRNDLLLSDGLLLKWQNNTYYSKQLEAIFLYNRKSFSSFLYIMTIISNLWKKSKFITTENYSNRIYLF